MKDAELVQATQEKEDSSKKMKRDPGMVINRHRKITNGSIICFEKKFWHPY